MKRTILVEWGKKDQGKLGWSLEFWQHYVSFASYFSCDPQFPDLHMGIIMSYTPLTVVLYIFLRVRKYYCKYLQSTIGFLNDDVSYFVYAASSQICPAAVAICYSESYTYLLAWYLYSDIQQVPNLIRILSILYLFFLMFPYLSEWYCYPHTSQTVLKT